MTCAWRELLAILPLWMRKDVDMQQAFLREIRLRMNAPPELIVQEKRILLKQKVTREDLLFTVNTASRYSPWAASGAASGYISIKGGHRIGLCGEAVNHNGVITGMGMITSLCVRVARDFPGIAEGLKKYSGSVLILGAPGWGKTTLLRDLIRQRDRNETVCVVDERAELFPPELAAGSGADVLSGCDKKYGIPMLLRTMGPACIAVDEITEPEDVKALLEAANCGVRLMATAHASSLEDYHRRLVYKPLWENRVFDTVVVLDRYNRYTAERMIG